MTNGYTQLSLGNSRSGTGREVRLACDCGTSGESLSLEKLSATSHITSRQLEHGVIKHGARKLERTSMTAPSLS